MNPYLSNSYNPNPYGNQPYGQPNPYASQQVTQTTYSQPNAYAPNPYAQPNPYASQQVTQTTYGQPYGAPYAAQTTYSQPNPYAPTLPSYGNQQTQHVQQNFDPMSGSTTTTTTTTTYATVPQTYARVSYNWGSPYNRHSSFAVPYGVDPMTAEKMMYASEIFRMFDTDFNSVLTFDEFVHVMNYLGYMMSSHEAVRLFRMIDLDGSGAIDEREFVSYWIYATGPAGGFRFDHHLHRTHRRPINLFGVRVGSSTTYSSGYRKNKLFGLKF